MFFFKMNDYFIAGEEAEAGAEARPGREGAVREEAGAGQRLVHGAQRLEAAAGKLKASLL